MRSKPEEILKKVRRIEISTRKIVDTMLSGQYHTRFKGQGMQFSDFREYFPGDDIRHIDWKVTARTQSAHIKKFEEERDLTVYIVMDVSSSGGFGTHSKSKLDAISEVCALIAFAAVKNNDRVGLVLFADDVIKHVPPKKGQSHAMRLVSEMLHEYEGLRKTNIKTALDYVARVLKHSSVIFLASDFYDKNYEKILRRIGRKHDLIALRMRDPKEAGMPKVGRIEFEDAETGESFNVDTGSWSFQENFKKEHAQFETELQTMFTKAGVDRIDLWTNEDYFTKIVNWFKARKRK